MSRRGTNIRKRADGRWEGRYYIVDTAGSKKCKSVYGHSYKEVTERLLSAKAASLNQTIAPKQSAITVKEVAEKWLKSIASSQKCSTIQKYSTIYNKYIKPNWGESVIDQLNHNEILKLLPETAGESVTKSILCIFNSILAYGAATYGTVASEMTLGEAIVREILPEPKYVIAMYSYKKELEQLKKRIEGLSNPGLVSENEKLLEQLKRALEQADGLTEVFARQMTKPDGKYIVFCSGREHMDEMKSQAADWFSKVDKKPHIYTAYYNDASTSKAFAEFKKDTGSHLKLLYCIDMLNEGIHVDDVDGVILLRPTVSPIIYLQQIGRALSAGSKNQPVIFDLVNNFDSLYCIDCLKNEMQEAFLLYPDTHSPREHFDDRFRIIDETKDSREIFMRLQENLGSAWDTYYEAAKQWYEENGNLKIPKSYVTGAGLTLGAWINTQRRVKSGNISGNLTWEKIQKLNDIGMIWDVTDSSWQEVLEELKSYRNTYGNLDIKAKYVSPTGFRLGSWINNMRFKVKKYGIEQALTDEQRKALEELGMIWDHNKQKWEEYYSAAKAYYKEHGNLEVPAKYVTAEGIPLGRWLSNQTNSRSMTDEQLQRLQSIGYMSESRTAIQWNRKFELAKIYYEKNGNLDVPVSYSTDGVKLGRWISNIRCKRKNPKASGMVLDTERIARLDSIGMNWK